jgi:hypothetical protein
MADIGTLNPEQMLQQQQILRQQKMAEMLMQQGMQQPQGQMVSGRYVAPSIFQNLAGLANVYMGQRGIERAEQAQLDLAKRLRADETSAMADFMQQRQGRPAIAGTPDIPTETYETVKGTPAQAAIPPNPQAAYANLMANPKASPRLQNMAFNKLIADPEGFTLPEGSIRYERMPDGTIKAVAAGADKTRGPVTIGNYLVDPQTGKVIFQAPKDGSGKDFGNALALRKEFNGEGIYKGYQEVKNAWSQINTGLNAKSPAGDLAAATKFMKLLDPTSVVRESELLMAMQASGALDRLYNYAQMRVAGTKLTPTQREDFRTLSDEFYKTSLNQYNEKFNEYKDIALRNNLNPDDIGKPDIFKTQVAPKKEEKPKVSVGQQLNIPAVKAPKFLGFEPAPTGQ